MVEEALTRPFCAWRGPVKVPTVKVPIVPVVELSTWIVDDPFTMRLFGMVTRPEGATAKSEVVAEPFAFVEEETLKIGMPETPTRRMPAVANGVVVPMVKEVAKRFCSVEEAVLMSPPLKLIKVEVAIQVLSVVKGYAKVAAPKVAAERQVVP